MLLQRHPRDCQYFFLVSPNNTNLHLVYTLELQFHPTSSVLWKIEYPFQEQFINGFQGAYHTWIVVLCHPQLRPS
jgi:hypothetical protein